MRLPKGSVNIKIDTGMSRNGCQPNVLEDIVKVSLTMTMTNIFIAHRHTTINTFTNTTII